MASRMAPMTYDFEIRPLLVLFKHANTHHVRLTATTPRKAYAALGDELVKLNVTPPFSVVLTNPPRPAPREAPP